MIGDTQTRRTFVFWSGDEGAASTVPYDRGYINGTTRRASSTHFYDLDPAALVLTADDMPSGFTAVENPDEPSLMTHLREVDARFENAAVALTAFWAGTDSVHPTWMVTSLACVCDHELARDALTTGTNRHDELREEYEDALPDSYSVEQSERLRLIDGRWRIDLPCSPTDWECQDSPSPAVTHLLKLQWRGNILLGTIVYGPCGDEPGPETRLDYLADLQLTRFTDWRDTDA